MIGRGLNQQMILILMTLIVTEEKDKMMMSISGKKCINPKSELNFKLSIF
tara:strand:- start:708 stop:857 length:150 start_codon:yes stop_codon:yes gene_type:complete